MICHIAARIVRSTALWALGAAVLGAVAAGAQQHPVYTQVDPAKAEQYEREVARVMAMSEEEMLRFLPDKQFVRSCDCPKCYGGSEGINIFTWTVERPNELTCRYCGETISLPSERYPETGVLSGQNALGETVEYHYYENPQRQFRHFLSDHLLFYHRSWLENQCVALGKAWRATGKPEYARRVALVLDKAARLYPHYAAIHNGIAGRIAFCRSQQPPYSWDAGRWGYFHNEIPRNMILAYDLIYDSPVFEELSAELGYDVRERIVRDFFRPTYDALVVNKYHVSNVVGYDIASAAMLGRIIGAPDMVHRAVGWMLQNLDEGFCFDGCWSESPSYHYMTLGGLQSAFRTVEGYSDPPDYRDPVDGMRFENLNPSADLPFWGKVQQAFKAIDYPDGTAPAVHDTWSHERRSAPRQQTGCALLPGWGHASLGRGSGAHQMLAQLHFSGAYGHSHLDNLNLTLWAKEREMLSDIGYTWTDIRWWTACTISHNLVAVDRAEQGGRPGDGDLLWYFPAAGDHDISVVEADGRRAYSNISGLDMYRRLVALVPVSETDAYVLDIFRTRGGSVHDWLLHGSADEDMTVHTALPLAPAGTEFAGEQPPKTYALWRNVRSAHTETGLELSFEYADDADRGLRVHLLGSSPTEVYLGETPSVRRAGKGTQGDNRKILDFWMPHLCARRSGPAPLHSLFAAIEEPFRGGPFLDAVTRLEVTPADENCVALEVTCGDLADTIISTLDEPPFVERRAGDVTLRGRLGIVRRVRDKVIGLWLFEGTELSAAEQSISAERSGYSGTIRGAQRKLEGAGRDAFITEAELPVGDDLHGRWMIVTHGNGSRHGYEIDRIEREGDRTVIVLTADHGLRISGDTTEEVYFPRRTMTGPNTFLIPLRASLVAD